MYTFDMLTDLSNLHYTIIEPVTVFRDFEDVYYGQAHLSTDAIEVFNYFNGAMITAMVRSVKNSLEKLRHKISEAK